MRRKKPPSQGGRPSKLTTALALSLVAGAHRGDSLDEIARAVGIGPATLYRWLALGRGGDPTYKALADAIREARSALADCVQKAREAARAEGALAAVGYALLKRGF
jgi:transposase-like protein